MIFLPGLQRSSATGRHLISCFLLWAVFKASGKHWSSGWGGGGGGRRRAAGTGVLLRSGAKCIWEVWNPESLQANSNPRKSHQTLFSTAIPLQLTSPSLLAFCSPLTSSLAPAQCKTGPLVWHSLKIFSEWHRILYPTPTLPEEVRSARSEAVTNSPMFQCLHAIIVCFLPLQSPLWVWATLQGHCAQGSSSVLQVTPTWCLWHLKARWWRRASRGSHPVCPVLWLRSGTSCMSHSNAGHGQTGSPLVGKVIHMHASKGTNLRLQTDTHGAERDQVCVQLQQSKDKLRRNILNWKCIGKTTTKRQDVNRSFIVFLALGEQAFPYINKPKV